MFSYFLVERFPLCPVLNSCHDSGCQLLYTYHLSVVDPGLLDRRKDGTPASPLLRGHVCYAVHVGPSDFYAHSVGIRCCSIFSMSRSRWYAIWSSKSSGSDRGTLTSSCGAE